jgi:hypothetical protein
MPAGHLGVCGATCQNRRARPEHSLPVDLLFFPPIRLARANAAAITLMIRALQKRMSERFRSAVSFAHFVGALLAVMPA